MHWFDPLYLYGLWVLPLLAGFFFASLRKKRHELALFGEESLMRRLTRNHDARRIRLKNLLKLTAVFFLIIAIARPQIGTHLGVQKRRGIDIIVALDVSSSMLAEDMKPNRLEAAKRELASLIDLLAGDRIGIVTFAGASFVQCPLTLDYHAAKLFLDAVSIQSIPVPGTNLAEAITRATAAFNKRERKHKVLILLTDGENHGFDPIKAAEAAHKEGVRIYTIGIGNPEGELIPVRDSQGKRIGYKKDKSGEVVMSKLDEYTLQKIALTCEGKYFRATAGQLELDRIYETIAAMEKKELSSRLYTRYEERFQYPLFCALILLIIEFLLGTKKKKM